MEGHTILEPRRIAGKTLAAWKSGFAIRDRGLVVHLVADGEKQRSLLSRLGKHKMGKACPDFKAR